MEEKERFELNDNDCIIDNEKNVIICDVCDVSESPKILVDLLNQQDKRIKELEEQLKNKPKFNVGDKVYLINKDEEVERDFIESIDIDTFGIEYYTVMHSICWYENELFSTKDEAEEKLKKLKV